MKWTKPEDFSKMGLGCFLRRATFVEFCFKLMIKPKSLSWASQSGAFKSLKKMFAILKRPSERLRRAYESLRGPSDAGEGPLSI